MARRRSYILPFLACAAVSTAAGASAVTTSPTTTTTPLLQAILAHEDEKTEEIMGDEAAALAAIEAGADVNERNTTFNDTPLLRSAMLGQLGIVTLLCKHGAEPNDKGPDDWTALMWASRRSLAVSADLVAVLLEAGADSSAASSVGYTALHVAASHGNMATVMTLVEGEASVHARDNEGATPLVVAASAHSQSQLLRYLVRAGANVDEKDDRGSTPLHWAAFRGHHHNVKTLLALGADPTIMERDNWTPLQIAKQFEHGEVVELLEDATATATKKPGSYTKGKKKKSGQGTCVAGENCT